MGKTQSIIDKLPKDVLDMVNTNIQALQYSKCSSFSELPDWTNQGKLTDKPLKGGKLEGSHQLTVKHRDSYRVIYVAQHEEFIVVLHSFKKKVEGKAKKEMRTVEERLARLNADIKAGHLY